MDTPFPFPWAQAVNFVLIVFCLTVPFVIVAHTTTVYMAVAITFIAVHTHVMLNEVRCMPPLTCSHHITRTHVRFNEVWLTCAELALNVGH